MRDQAEKMMDGSRNGLGLPDPEASRAEARRRITATFRKGERIWLLKEQHNPEIPAWDIDILRPGLSGRWMHQRYRYDTIAGVLYFFGEHALSDAEFREARRNAKPFTG